MKNYDKLHYKYAVKSPILPPSPDETTEVAVPIAPDDPEDKWIKLLQESEGIDPLTEKPAESPNTMIQRMQEPEDDFDTETPAYEKELLKILHPKPEEYKETKIAPDVPTKPPPGKRSNLSPGTLLKMCSKFYDLCSKF